MDISLDLLIESVQQVEWLEAACPEVAVTSSSVRLNHTSLLSANGELLLVDTLWCGYLSNILSLNPALRSGRTFLGFGTEEEFNAVLRKQDCNCIFFPAQVGLAGVFNEVANIFRRFHTWEHEMDLCIARQEPLQKLVDVTDGVVSNPIMAWNASFEIVAFSRKHTFDRPQIQPALEERRFTGEDIERFVRMRYLQDTERFSRLTLVYPPNWMDCPFGVRVFTEGEKTILSMTQYFLHRAPTPGQLELLRFFETKLGEYVDRVLKTGQRSKTYLYEPFLIDLMDGNITEKEAITDRVKALNIPYEASFRLYCISFGRYSASISYYTRTNCKSIFPHAKVVAHHKRLVVLDRSCGAEQREALTDYQREKLSELLELCGGTCGVSHMFPNLSCMRAAYEQASSALRVQELVGRERLVFFSDAFFWDMLDWYTEHSASTPQMLCSPRLKAVIHNDESTGNDNLRLLDIHLNNDRNITNTAKEMNLHRNSVIYRLERIEQMLGGSLNDSELRFQMLVSLRVLGYAQKKSADRKKEEPQEPEE